MVLSDEEVDASDLSKINFYDFLHASVKNYYISMILMCIVKKLRIKSAFFI
jgi:hypothetical protein